jgi:hypothetical protein
MSSNEHRHRVVKNTHTFLEEPRFDGEVDFLVVVVLALAPEVFLACDVFLVAGVLAAGFGLTAVLALDEDAFAVVDLAVGFVEGFLAGAFLGATAVLGLAGAALGTGLSCMTK